MTARAARPGRRGAALLVVAVAAVLALGPAAPAHAHASLVSTDPEEGAVLDSAPEQVVLTFNEPVVSVPDGVTVFAANGDAISASATARDADLVVALDEDPGEGTLVVVWRVVSADGHPIAGSLSFSIGAPSETTIAPDAGGVPTDEVPVALSLVRWIGYAALLLAVGLVWFGVLLVRPRDAVAPRVRGVAGVAAAVAAAAWLVGLPLTGAYQRGVGLAHALDDATWRTLPGEEYLIALLVAAGTLNAVVLRGRGAAALGLVAVAAPALSGHTRAAPPVALSVAADVLHLAAGSVWLGGLVGLALTLPRLAAGPSAALVSRFSTLAAGILAALVASGSFMAWRIVGSWNGLVSTDYGRLLLVKIGVALVAVAIAAVNRFVLLPRGGGSLRTLLRTVTAEAAVLVVVLLVTGFLVNTSPEDPDAPPASAASDVERTTLGDLVVLATLTPGSTGQNTLTLQVQDASGEPAEGQQAPTARVTSGAVDLGSVPLTATATGTYEGDVVLPEPGQWEVQVSLRIDEFENPVGVLIFDVG